MKKLIVRTLKILGITAGSLVALAVVGVALLNTSYVQQKLLRRATAMLTEKLETKVEIDSLTVGLFSDDIRLIGLRVDDRQQRRLLQIGSLGVDVELWSLLHNELNVNEVSVRGIRANLYKASPDEPANYQFVLDAFKKDKQAADDKQTADDKAATKKKLAVNLKSANISDAQVTYNGNAFSFESLKYREGWSGKRSATLSGLKAAWSHIVKKRHQLVDDSLSVDVIRYEEEDDQHLLSIDSLRFLTDNHRPRRNAGKPKRGFFDEGHLNVVACLKARIDHVDKDSVHGVLTAGDVNDRGSGLHVRDLRCQVGSRAGRLSLTDVTVGLANTSLTIKSAELQLPSKKQGRPLRFSTSTINGKVLLKDIARPFAPVLGKFNIPLQLSVKFSGSDSMLSFRNVKVNTADRSLNIHANGDISGLKDKHQLKVHFNVSQMLTDGHTAERIINQFAVKKFMMKQLHALGTIRYVGSFDVLWHREQFRGRLHTKPGFLNFNLMLNEDTKYLNGHVQTTGFELGQAMDMPGLGAITCQADFRFDYSKPRTAKMRRVKGGKLPIGEIDAQVDEASYKKIKARNVEAHLTSDGAVAEGNITVKGKRVDLLCSFSFTNTNEMKNTKIKPGIRFHKMSDEDKAKRDDQRAQKKAERAERKEQKKAERAERKAQKEAERAERKVQKEAERAERKARKEAERAERKARKEAEREAKKQRKEQQ